jgi:hypothetical protein
MNVLVYFRDISNIPSTATWTILYPLGNFVVIRNIFNLFGIFYQEKSGNPA